MLHNRKLKKYQNLQILQVLIIYKNETSNYNIE
jgi:hypothetical protein